MPIHMQALLKPRASGPFEPLAAILGGTPTPNLDVPITVFFLMLFVIGGGFHLYTHEINKKRQHKFHLSALMFDFCLVRTLTCTMRIVWAYRPNNNGIILTALIFENAGAVVLFAVNAIFTQRIVRALHPNFGWSPLLNAFFLLIISSVPFIIIYNIVFTVVSFYTQISVVQDVVHGFLVFGLCYSLFLSILPVLFVVPGLLVPRSAPLERFAKGRFRSKIAILLLSTMLLFAGAIVRTISYLQENPAQSPGAIDSKEVFYITSFTFEIMVVVLYAVMRIDRRFHVPDGAKGPGDYIRLQRDEEKFFQDMDVKSPYTDAGSGMFETQSWFGEGGLVAKPTREQVRKVIHSLGFPAEIVGMPMDCGDDEEILIYAFRVRKQVREQKPKKMILRQSGRWSVDTAFEQQAVM